MKTNEDYTVEYDKFIGKITVPKGTKLTHKTALGEDKNYHFVDDWSWFKPELFGYVREMYMLDLTHRGLDVPKEYVDYEEVRVINIKFEGIDDWNRPVFKAVDSHHRFGDVNNLLSYSDKEEINFYMNKCKRNPNDYLEWFGTKFGCEPHGGLDTDLKLVIID